MGLRCFKGGLREAKKYFGMYVKVFGFSVQG